MTGSSRETLTLSTHRVSFGYVGKPAMPADMVTAIDAPCLNRYEVQLRYARLPGGAEAEKTWRITLAMEAARRLITFYQLTMMSTKRSGTFECHTFPAFVHGARHNLGLGSCEDGYTAGERVRPYAMDEGEPFMMFDARQAGKHAFLGMGIEHPRHCLGVLGGNGMLAVTNTLQTMDTFDATYIAPIQYPALVDAT